MNQTINPMTIPLSTPRWQYHTLTYSNEHEFEKRALTQMNELGAQGWDLCGFVRFVVGRIDNYRIILKRAY
jgi:hypothetical protein